MQESAKGVILCQRGILIHLVSAYFILNTVFVQTFWDASGKVAARMSFWCPVTYISKKPRSDARNWATHLTKSSMVDPILPSAPAQWTVRLINEMTLGDVQPSAQRWSFPGYAWGEINARSKWNMRARTLRIAATLTRHMSNIALTSCDTVKCDGTSTLLSKSVKISLSSSSSTIAKGQWRRATQIASFMRNFCGV